MKETWEDYKDGYQPTYEELKPRAQDRTKLTLEGYQPTYEELKPETNELRAEWNQVTSLPMRN